MALSTRESALNTQASDLTVLALALSTQVSALLVLASALKKKSAQASAQQSTRYICRTKTMKKVHHKDFNILLSQT